MDKEKKEGWIVKKINSEADKHNEQGEFLSGKSNLDANQPELKWIRTLEKDQAPVLEVKFTEIKNLIEKNKLSVNIYRVDVGMIGSAIFFESGEICNNPAKR